ncbi:MAG: NAD(P)H-dependent oxidoreductase [Clostridia bacterium]|nr:NAD(P)H-dependent oxidoreductase [Clostridia bacterium]
MKIVLIHGQSHRGSSYRIGNMLADRFPDCVKMEFFLPSALPHFCSGCCACIEDEAKCPYYAEKRKITDAIDDADLLIFTTPTYCMGASAPMKAFIDLTFARWMSHKPRKAMFGKKAVVVSTAAGAGTGRAIKDVGTALFYMGVPYIKSYGIALRAWSLDEIGEKRMAKIERDIDRLARSVGKTKKVRVGIKTRFMFGVMRQMQLKNRGASPREKEYWLENGWLGKGRPWKE